MAVMFLVVSLAMFLLYNLIPSDPVRAELEPMRSVLKPAEYQEMYFKLRAERGLDDPIMLRFGRWM